MTNHQYRAVPSDSHQIDRTLNEAFGSHETSPILSSQIHKSSFISSGKDNAVEIKCFSTGPPKTANELCVMI